jgi:hypothetical protein
VGQEYFINNQELENKVRDLLPSQGGAGAGFDLSASTQIIPIIDLTESAEGSNVRGDLQTALSLNSQTAFNILNTTTTVINNTGYFRIFGNAYFAGAGDANFRFTDGTTTKIILNFSSSGTVYNNFFDFNVFMEAGVSMTIQSSSNSANIIGSTRQIANIDGVLVNP